MKLSRELSNGFIIFTGIALYFLLISAIGLGDKAYLRLFNTVFVLYGVNKTVSMNVLEGKTEFISNFVSAMKTSIFGVTFSVIGLLIYSYARGGEAYIQSLSESFLFAGNPSIVTYSICLLFEGIASSVLVAMLIMLYWNDRQIAD